MKKESIKPELMVEVLETVEMIATSMRMYDGQVDTEKEQLGTGRRGQWGNLWFTED